MDKIALGFSNTVDYEIEWDSGYLEELIRRTGLCRSEIEEKQDIRTMKDLLSSILFHMEEGTGCGFLTEAPEVIEEFIAGTSYHVALGGSNLRAAETISELGGSAAVHLVSLNEDTVNRMPANIRYVGGQTYRCCFPHIAVQFPKNACIRANDIEIIAPRENRVIYSGDIACARMPLDADFFECASRAQAVLLSGFDMVADSCVLNERLSEIKIKLKAFPEDGPVIFYEHACFGDREKEALVRRELGTFIDIYSMNEDEFQSLLGKRIDLLDVKSVLEGLEAACKELSGMTIVVHTCYWALAVGKLAGEVAGALENGMLAATTRYWKGAAGKKEIEETKKQPLHSRAKIFAERMEANSHNRVRCIPVVDVHTGSPTTIGLGDCFVGGFLYKYCSDIIEKEI